MVWCIRKAWLELGGETLALEDDVAGYFCTELNLGYPEVRDVVNNRAGRHGVTDRSAFFGSRAISANITGRGGTMTLDEIATVFAHWMLPDLRPELHYVLERPGQPERFVVVRAANYAWPISGASTRAVQLNWIAADPTMYDATECAAQATAGSGGVTTDRFYPLVFPREYLSGTGTTPTAGSIRSSGDTVLRPVFDIFGPITTPQLDLDVTDGRKLRLWFNPGVRIDGGHHIEIDTAAHTAYWDADPAQPALSDLDWANSTWPVLPVLDDYTTMELRGDSTTEATYARASWFDGFVS
jgi:hypothetical protein